MQFKVDTTYDRQLRDVLVSHDHESINWNAEMYSRSTLQKPEVLFDNLNSYLRALPIETQDRLWSLYKTLYENLETIHDPHRLHLVMQKMVAELYEILTFEDLKRWVLLHGHLNIPEDLKVAHGLHDTEMTKRLTYLRDDYYDLVVFSSLLKALIPLFGECVRRMSKEVRSKFKEHYAFSLLGTSVLLRLPAFYRLRDYVEAKTQNEERKNPAGYRKNSAIFGGLGTSELPDWLLAKALVRRVTIHEESVGDNVVANVYHTIDQQISSLDKTFNGRVNEKRLYNNQTDEDNVSIVENYKVKQEISDGDLAILSVYAEYPENIAQHVDPGYNPELLALCLANGVTKTRLSIGKPHLTLAQWVLARAITPRGIPALTKPVLLKALSVTQALLWHWGFTELAALVFAEPTASGSAVAIIPTSRLNKKTIDQLVECFPHYQLPTTAGANVRSYNVACKAIDTLAVELIQSDWLLQGPPGLYSSLRVTDPARPYVVSAEIRQQLSDLLIRLYNLRREVAST